MRRHLTATLFFLFLSFNALADSNEYINPTIGFHISKPVSWQFSSVQTNLSTNRLNNAALSQAIIKYSSAPLVVMTKYAEPYPDINPSLKINIKPLGQLAGRDAKDIAGLTLPSLQRIFKDFSIIQPPSDIMLSGMKGAYTRATYSIEGPGIKSFPVSYELWIIPHGNYFLMIAAGTRTDEKTGSRQDIQKILKTMIIEP